MSDTPGGATVNCPQCNARATAIVPRGSTIVEGEGEADGKVWVNCHNCDHRFLVHFRTDR